MSEQIATANPGKQRDGTFSMIRWLDDPMARWPDNLMAHDPMNK